MLCMHFCTSGSTNPLTKLNMYEAFLLLVYYNAFGIIERYAKGGMLVKLVKRASRNTIRVYIYGQTLHCMDAHSLRYYPGLMQYSAVLNNPFKKRLCLVPGDQIETIAATETLKTFKTTTNVTAISHYRTLEHIPSMMTSQHPNTREGTEVSASANNPTNQCMLCMHLPQETCTCAPKDTLLPSGLANPSKPAETLNDVQVEAMLMHTNACMHTHQAPQTDHIPTPTRNHEASTTL